MCYIFLSLGYPLTQHQHFTAHNAFGPGVYGTTMGFGSDPYQVAVNNWGPNAA